MTILVISPGQKPGIHSIMLTPVIVVTCTRLYKKRVPSTFGIVKGCYRDDNPCNQQFKHENEGKITKEHTWNADSGALKMIAKQLLKNTCTLDKCVYQWNNRY